MALEAEFLLAARVLFGGVLAFMGFNHLSNADAMVPYAEAKGVPAAGFMVPATGVMLIVGGAGIALGTFPVLAAGAIAVFLLVTTPVMHDFWTAEGEEAQQEMTQFLKNAALLGGALVFLALGGEAWTYSVGVGLF